MSYDKWSGGIEATGFDRVIREGLIEEATFEQKPEASREEMCISGVVEKGKCIGPRVVCLA